MKKIPIFIILRSLTFVAIGFYVFGEYKIAEFNLLLEQKQVSFEKYIALKDSVRYYKLLMPAFFLIDGLYTFFNMERQPDGSIILRKFLFPEFNYSDEREAELTGKAAKASLAVILFYSIFILICSMVVLLTSIPTAYYFIFAIVSIPIVSLITYYSSYRYYHAH